MALGQCCPLPAARMANGVNSDFARSRGRADHPDICCVVRVRISSGAFSGFYGHHAKKGEPYNIRTFLWRFCFHDEPNDSRQYDPMDLSYRDFDPYAFRIFGAYTRSKGFEFCLLRRRNRYIFLSRHDFFPKRRTCAPLWLDRQLLAFGRI